jgi:protocatechuate 3,4-dioxygenase beta subunit
MCADRVEGGDVSPSLDDHAVADRISRRSTLVRAGGLAAAAITAGSAPAGALASGQARSAAVACLLSPEMTDGPYYLPGEKLRRNISEGLPGAPLALRFGVVDAATCKPIKAAAVDIWHASAAGKYSGEEANDTVGLTFLRGIQRTDAMGLALFQTVYPGWYPGRAVHIHVKVHLGGDVLHTGQVFFRDSFTDAVYRRAPYRGRGARNMRNADDSIFLDGGSRSLLRMRTTGKGYTGSITLGVRRN